MINSISSNQNYLYETSKSSSSASTLLASISQNQKASSQEELTKVLAVTGVEEYSAEEHLEMMRSGKVAQIYEANGSGRSTAAGDISFIDADGDGTISADEYEEMMSQMGIQNALTADEFFAKFDANEDGEISLDEMPEPGTAGMRAEETEASQPPMGPPPLDDETLAEYDIDGDGILSQEEYSAMMESLRSQKTDTSSSISEELQNMTLQALKVYENNYESMFETKEGSLLNNQA